MDLFELQSATARRYLQELERALADTPSALRADVSEGIAEELRGLDDAEAAERIAELGDPRAIAADVNAEVETPAAAPAPSPAYAVVTAVVLTAGWYVVPFVGWLAGLIMIGMGANWTASVRRRAILASIGVIVVSLLALVALRGTSISIAALIIFAVLPLIGNIFVSAYLRSHWGEKRSM